MDNIKTKTRLIKFVDTIEEQINSLYQSNFMNQVVIDILQKDVDMRALKTDLNNYYNKTEIDNKIDDIDKINNNVDTKLSTIDNKLQNITATPTVTLFDKNIGLIGGNIFIDQKTTTSLHSVQFKLKNNHYARITAYINSNNNNGYLELSTANTGNQSIYVRQYSTLNGNNWGKIVNQLTLLDANGNTVIPNKLYIKDIKEDIATYLNNKVSKTSLENYYTKNETDVKLTNLTATRSYEENDKFDKIKNALIKLGISENELWE